MIHLSHIGIAVSDLPALEKLFRILGVQESHAEEIPEQGVRTHFLPIEPEASGSHLELLEVTDPEGTVAQFIRKRGAGIHHLSFSVPRGALDPLCDRLRNEEYRLTYDTPKSGAHRMRVNFIHPASAGGMLIELSEPQ